MSKYKPCLIDRNKIPFNGLWREANYFSTDIVCAVGTDFMQKIAEAENRFIFDLLNRMQQEEVVDAVPVVRCRDCKHMAIQSNARYCTVWNGINGMGDDGFCNYGERKEGVE